VTRSWSKAVRRAGSRRLRRRRPGATSSTRTRRAPRSCSLPRRRTRSTCKEVGVSDDATTHRRGPPLRHGVAVRASEGGLSRGRLHPEVQAGQAITLTASGTVTGGRLQAVTGDRTCADSGADSAAIVGVAGYDGVSGDSITVFTRAGGVHEAHRDRRDRGGRARRLRRQRPGPDQGARSTRSDSPSRPPHRWRPHRSPVPLKGDELMPTYTYPLARPTGR
jgi:hypothetical protein